MNRDKLLLFEERIKYSFYEKKLLHRALTHSSYGNEIYRDKKHNNERLEFLGDAVLELSVSDFLYKNYHEMPEGELTKLRASIVCEQTLAICAREIGLDEVVFLGKGEELSGGRFRDSIISDAFEALLGAIYLDGGIECATRFVRDYVLKDIENKKLFIDSKSILQERIQAGYTSGPTYHLIGESGPDHCKEFIVEVRVEEKVVGEGKGRTKKAAEQQAAYNAILKMQNETNK